MVATKDRYLSFQGDKCPVFNLESTFRDPIATRMHGTHFMEDRVRVDRKGGLRITNIIVTSRDLSLVSVGCLYASIIAHVFCIPGH